MSAKSATHSPYKKKVRLGLYNGSSGQIYAGLPFEASATFSASPSTKTAFKVMNMQVGASFGKSSSTTNICVLPKSTILAPLQTPHFAAPTKGVRWMVSSRHRRSQSTEDCIGDSFNKTHWRKKPVTNLMRTQTVFLPKNPRGVRDHSGEIRVKTAFTARVGGIEKLVQELEIENCKAQVAGVLKKHNVGILFWLVTFLR